MKNDKKIDDFARVFVYVIGTCIALAAVAITTNFILWLFGM